MKNGTAAHLFASIGIALGLAVVGGPNAYAQTDPLAGIIIAPESDASYNRARDYGGWLRMNAPYNRCFNVRDQVLADESVKSKFKFHEPENGWHCKITAGSWKEPYTARHVTNPKELDIDHLVPLKEAHQSGAHAWPKEKRKEYANYLRDPDHLLAVDAGENRSKGDKDPPNYMPPNPAYRCSYLQKWIAVKRRWELTMDQVEAAFIRQELATC
jgi:hypothetical protein